MRERPSTDLAKFLPAGQLAVAEESLESIEAEKLWGALLEIATVLDGLPGKDFALAETIDAAAVQERAAGRINIALKDIEELREKVAGPLYREWKRVNGIFTYLQDPIKGILEKANRFQIAWHRAEETRRRREAEDARRREEEAARLEAVALARAEKAKTEEDRLRYLEDAEVASREQAKAAVAAPRPLPSGFKTDEGSSRIAERWVIQVVKPELVPREYLAPDDKKIRTAVAAGVREIPGVAITLEDTITRRVR